MAPGDRLERRQQRVRGAGPSSVQTNFGFNLAALVLKSKQAPAPPPLRRTPTPSKQTPRPVHSSAKRRRSASVRSGSSRVKRHATPRSRSVKTHATPKESTVTPYSGKRKRDHDAEENNEVDDLSPDHDKELHSVEKNRKFVANVLPIREEGNFDEEPDELSFVEDALRQSTVRRSKSFEPPITPGMLPNDRQRLSGASQSAPALATPSVQQQEEESEDELTPRINDATPRPVSARKPTEPPVQEEDDEVDELTSPPQPVVTPQSRPKPRPKSGPKSSQKPIKQSHVEAAPTPLQARRGRPKRIAPDEVAIEKAIPTPAPAKRGRRKRVVLDEEDEVQATPAASQPRRIATGLATQEHTDNDDVPDEISPETSRTKQPPKKKTQHAKKTKEQSQDKVVEISSAEESDDYEPEDDEGIHASRPAPSQQQKPSKPKSTSEDEPPRKRQKFSGPKQAISVMRIKGSTVRGVTVADTTRTILEQILDHQLARMAEKMQVQQDSSRRKQIRSQINTTLAFKESLSEKLMDLQDANDTLSTGFKNRKVLRAANIARRKEILAIQNNRHEIALEVDDEQAQFDEEKKRVEETNKLSDNLFAIQAAIQSGRALARRQDRDTEGPHVPLSMLLENVGRSVGSVGGAGLLENIRSFNNGLERTAGWLEGRA